MRVLQPIPYQGSKRKIAPDILRFFPPKISRIVEPFAGSAAISLAAAIHNRASKFWINDSHPPLMALWSEIIERPEATSAKYTSMWSEQLGIEREYFNTIRQKFNKNSDPIDFLYLLARCVKGAIRYNSNGDFNNSPDNRRKGARPDEMNWRIVTASRLLKNRAVLTCQDYKDVLQACSTNDLIYMDPPYQGVCGKGDRRYYGSFDHDEFCNSLSELSDRGMMFAVSYDGRTGTKHYGNSLPKYLQLTRIEICAGPSTQATLLGRNQLTFESLYISPALASFSNTSHTNLETRIGLHAENRFEDLVNSS